VIGIYYINGQINWHLRDRISMTGVSIRFVLSSSIIEARQKGFESPLMPALVDQTVLSSYRSVMGFTIFPTLRSSIDATFTVGRRLFLLCFRLIAVQLDSINILNM